MADQRERQMNGPVRCVVVPRKKLDMTFGINLTASQFSAKFCAVLRRGPLFIHVGEKGGY